MIELPEKFSSELTERYESSAEDFKITRYEALISARDILARRCESPIELLLGAFIAPLTDGYNYLELRESVVGRPMTFGTVWAPQQAIDSYRADFLFRSMCEGHEGFVVVECDGHDYHERTKFQAKRDRSRDRHMLAKGVTVVRFTGSEIYADPQKCADDASVLISDCMDRLIAAAGHASFRNPSIL